MNYKCSPLFIQVPIIVFEQSIQNLLDTCANFAKFALHSVTVEPFFVWDFKQATLVWDLYREVFVWDSKQGI
jgi:hypothetical protein